MIIEYAVPSLALNYHSKKYQIINESVHSYTCMRNKLILLQLWICMKCRHTSNVEGDQYVNTQHAWACWDMVARGIVFLNSQTDSQMYTFPDQKNSQFVQILMNSKFQSKRVLGTDDVKQKTSLFSVQEKPAWYVFMVCSFVLYVICACYTK